MKGDKFKNKYRIKSTRLQNWDYSNNGYYFVTICTKNKNKYFGEIKNREMILNDIGKIAEKCWLEIPKHFDFVVLDEFVIMPNHIHGIIIINKNDISSLFPETQNLASFTETQNLASFTETQNLASFTETQNLASLRRWPNKQNKFGVQSKNLASIIRGFKIGVTKYANQNNITFRWQPRFYDRIIRTEIELPNIREYIAFNPGKWQEDENFVSELEGIL